MVLPIGFLNFQYLLDRFQVQVTVYVWEEFTWTVKARFPLKRAFQFVRFNDQHQQLPLTGEEFIRTSQNLVFTGTMDKALAVEGLCMVPANPPGRLPRLVGEDVKDLTEAGTHVSIP